MALSGTRIRRTATLKQRELAEARTASGVTRDGMLLGQITLQNGTKEELERADPEMQFTQV